MGFFFCEASGETDRPLLVGTRGRRMRQLFFFLPWKLSNLGSVLPELECLISAIVFVTLASVFLIVDFHMSENGSHDCPHLCWPAHVYCDRERKKSKTHSSSRV